MISLVKTEWFVYLHSDVYLPDNWFNEMIKHKKKYDFFECDRHYVGLVECKHPDLGNSKRALSGSQMGRKSAFENIINKIDDDYIY